jgi:hypothetical protein
MRRAPRIFVAIAISVILNILLLVLSASNPDGHTSTFWRAVDFVSKPSTVIAEGLFSHGHSPGADVFYALMCSIVYYAVIAWIAITLSSVFHTSIRHRRVVGKN